jgi:hypothetical protein
MPSLARLAMDWVRLASGHGVLALRIESAVAPTGALRDGLASRAPT